MLPMGNLPLCSSLYFYIKYDPADDAETTIVFCVAQKVYQEVARETRSGILSGLYHDGIINEIVKSAVDCE